MRPHETEAPSDEGAPNPIAVRLVYDHTGQPDLIEPTVEIDVGDGSVIECAVEEAATLALSLASAVRSAAEISAASRRRTAVGVLSVCFPGAVIVRQIQPGPAAHRQLGTGQ